MRSALETTDIFRGAFFLCNGGRLADVRLGGNGRQIVTFLIEGDEIHRLDGEYRTGRALVNPLQLRESLNHLRDILFATLRTHEGRTRDDDRKRDDSIHQRKR